MRFIDQERREAADGFGGQAGVDDLLWTDAEPAFRQEPEPDRLWASDKSIEIAIPAADQSTSLLGFDLSELEGGAGGGWGFEFPPSEAPLAPRPAPVVQPVWQDEPAATSVLWAPAQPNVHSSLEDLFPLAGSDYAGPVTDPNL